MDGAAPSMGGPWCGGLAVLGVAQGNTWLAVAGCGARAARASVPAAQPCFARRSSSATGAACRSGFAVAALAMIGFFGVNAGWQSLAMGLLFVGVPALDTTLVMVSRRRRGISILRGGRDHLTHRARERLRTAGAVALALGGLQAVSPPSRSSRSTAAPGPCGAVAPLPRRHGRRDRSYSTHGRPSRRRRGARTGAPSRRRKHDRSAPHAAAPLSLAPAAALVAWLSPFFQGSTTRYLWTPGWHFPGRADRRGIARRCALRGRAGCSSAGVGGLDTHGR